MPVLCSSLLQPGLLVVGRSGEQFIKGGIYDTHVDYIYDSNVTLDLGLLPTV